MQQAGQEKSSLALIFQRTFPSRKRHGSYVKREEKDLVKGYDLGVNAYVVKPVDFASFAEIVKEIGIFWVIINELPAGKG